MSSFPVIVVLQRLGGMGGEMDDKLWMLVLISGGSWAVLIGGFF
jgi:hypothetical protein